MAEKAEDFLVVCLHDREGFGPEVGPRIMEMVELTHPDQWEFIKPGTVLAYYRSRGRSKKGAADLACSLQSLQSRDLRYRRIALGQAQGRMLADMDFWGKVLSVPLGSATGVAIETARQKCGAPQA